VQKLLGAAASAVLIVLGLLSRPVSAFEPCGELRNAFDYRTMDRTHREMIEGAHFTGEVETLRRGTTGRVGGDIAFTLRSIPNHPRALAAMMRLAQREKKDKPSGSTYTMGCWFDRAIRFAPNDGAVRVLFGVYLSSQGQKQDAIKQLEMARELSGEDANLYYNLGLAYFDLKEYDRSLEHAHAAYRLGFPLPGLRTKLQKAGKWREPLPAPAAAGSPPSAGESSRPAEAGVQR
jgi:hypothetical protein